VDDVPVSPDAEKDRHGGLTDFGKVITANNNSFWEELVTLVFLNFASIDIMSLKEL
jgi:hypothetical protein